jgi:hypothetical protein
LQQWLGLDGAERRAMGERGRALFAERYEIKAAAAQFQQLLGRFAPGCPTAEPVRPSSR